MSSDPAEIVLTACFLMNGRWKSNSSQTSQHLLPWLAGETDHLLLELSWNVTLASYLGTLPHKVDEAQTMSASVKVGWVDWANSSHQPSWTVGERVVGFLWVPWLGSVLPKGFCCLAMTSPVVWLKIIDFLQFFFLLLNVQIEGLYNALSGICGSKYASGNSYTVTMSPIF